jgi:hypothetical protein
LRPGHAPVRGFDRLGKIEADARCDLGQVCAAAGALVRAVACYRRVLALILGPGGRLA